MNYGMKVTLSYKTGEIDTLRNVTEIHWDYPSIMGNPSGKVAFESYIHGTGITPLIASIKEFEAVLETEKADTF